MVAEDRFHFLVGPSGDIKVNETYEGDNCRKKVKSLYAIVSVQPSVKHVVFVNVLKLNFI